LTKDSTPDFGLDFPIIKRKVRGQRLVYLDNAATSLKPLQVVEAVSAYYRDECASVHRGAHYLSDEATVAFEEVRSKVANFINAESTQQIIFTAGTTASINMIAQSFGSQFIKPGDEILLTAMEHHSNIVPWQMLQDTRGAVL